MAYFLPIASGSSGNAGLYVDGAARILFDAGSNTKTIKNALSSVGLGLADLTHIFVTHTHRDHIGALPVLLKHTPAALYFSDNACSELEQELGERANPFTYGQVVDACGLAVKSFATPHDSYGSVGFVVGDKTFAYCTDLGYMTRDIAQAILGTHTLYIESNHDVEMLKRGPYPYFLKERILSANGHMSNADCAGFVCKSCENGTKNIILAHLSEENNRPDKALLETENALYRAGAGDDIRVLVAQKKNTQPPVELHRG